MGEMVKLTGLWKQGVDEDYLYCQSGRGSK